MKIGKSGSRKPINLMWTGILFSMIYWVLESVRDVFIFERGNILDRILTPDPMALWMRLLALFILLFFGIYVKSLINEHKKAEEKLQKQRVELEEEVV